VAIDEHVISRRHAAHFQVGAQGLHGDCSQEDDPVLEPFGLLDAHPPLVEVDSIKT
jgi:hypothetical protein